MEFEIEDVSCGHQRSIPRVQGELIIHPNLHKVLEGHLIASLCTVHLLLHCPPTVLIVGELVGQRIKEFWVQ